MSGLAATPGFARGATPAARPGLWLGWMQEALRALVTRRHLTEMDARMLKDIGLTRAEALQEAQRAPWDLGRPNA